MSQSHETDQPTPANTRNKPPPQWTRGFWSTFWRDPAHDARYMAPGPQKLNKVLEIIDSGKFNWKVYAVAASGFLASSYSLFATNVIKPAWYFVYKPCGRLNHDAGLAIDEVTLVGTAVGMLLGGHLADLWGRKKLYGLELATLIIATFGVVMASEGFMVTTSDDSNNNPASSSMDFYDWIVWWRFLLGIGIGAEYPLSAIIAAEWSSTKSRGRMLAGVYAMQAFARLLAPAVGLAAVGIARSLGRLPADNMDPDSNMSRLEIDKIWRATTGVVLIPAAIAVIFRLQIPETARFHSGIQGDIPKAIRSALHLYPQRKGSAAEVEVAKYLKERRATENNGGSAGSNKETDGGDTRHWYRKWFGGATKYLCNTRAGSDLVVISLLWLMMDILWYGISMESPAALATLWHDPSSSSSSAVAAGSSSSAERRAAAVTTQHCPEYDSWRTDPDQTKTISQILEQNAIRSMLVVSIGSLLGNFALVCIIDRFRRKRILIVTFVFLGVLFAITGSTLYASFQAGQSHLVTIIFFGVMHFFFTVGPKTVILILAVELFPTVYRGSFYGVAAATGKVGAITIRAIVGRTGNSEMALANRLLGFVGVSVLAALLCCLLPDVQRDAGTTQVEDGMESMSEEEDNSDTEQRESAESTPQQGQRTSTTSLWRAFIRPLENKTLEEIEPVLEVRVGYPS
ncbi:major facilitator superfamily domain-containing protein [Apodospora peruviana]|uniref:Major facilitator superfamily domain-containing protein n=1 Tax=Apodospora peruviana TaxID=516989 RepID=A0AAE0M9Z1_9PEZI|nr:major facilitator superfamily domain-containing protein [Apodospora peruviana]